MSQKEKKVKFTLVEQRQPVWDFYRILTKMAKDMITTQIRTVQIIDAVMDIRGQRFGNTNAGVR